MKIHNSAVGLDEQRPMEDLDIDWCLASNWCPMRVKDALCLVIHLQRLASSDVNRYRAFVQVHHQQLRLWLYQLGIAAASMGFLEVPDVLLKALPYVDMHCYQSIFGELDLVNLNIRQAVGG